MNKTLQTVLIVVIALVGVVVLVGAGFFLGRSVWGWNAFHPGGMMGGAFNRFNQGSQDGYGMMGPGMMGGYGYRQDSEGEYPYGYGPGMMGGANGYGMMGTGMMGGFGTATDADPLSAQDSLEAVEAYLADLGNDDLEVAEIMVFEYNSYAIVKEESTDIGAFELLVDPATGAVFPEYGPNMMWNLKYGMHAGSGFGMGMMGGNRGYGMMGPGMMGGNYLQPSDEFDVEEGPVSEEEALVYAQEYLDANEPGVTVSDEITQFYGYYTIDLEKDGEIVGMLSVNGFSGQVFPHFWHGEFIEMVEYDH